MTIRFRKIKTIKRHTFGELITDVLRENPKLSLNQVLAMPVAFNLGSDDTGFGGEGELLSIYVPSKGQAVLQIDIDTLES